MSVDSVRHRTPFKHSRLEHCLAGVQYERSYPYGHRWRQRWRLCVDSWRFVRHVLRPACYPRRYQQLRGCELVQKLTLSLTVLLRCESQDASCYLCVFAVGIMGIISLISTAWQIFGLFFIVIILSAVASTHQTASYVFTSFNDPGVGISNNGCARLVLNSPPNSLPLSYNISLLSRN